MDSRKNQQERVSSQATEPKDNQNTYTEEETSLAAKYHVEPKLIRMISEIVGEHTSEITELSSLIKGEKSQQAETQDRSIEEKLTAPEQVEPEQPAEQEQPAEPCLDQQTQERIKSYYKSLDPKTKLAIATLSEIQCLDGINFQARQKEGKLFNEIWSDLESVCVETFHRQPDEDIPFGITDTEDVWLSGVWEACRMVLHNS